MLIDLLNSQIYQHVICLIFPQFGGNQPTGKMGHRKILLLFTHFGVSPVRENLFPPYCIPCKINSVTRVYVGESSRSSYERGGEHFSDYSKMQIDSHMFKHAMNDHPGETKPEFQFKVIKTFQSALDRQISEAVRIRRRGESVLNSKGVYNRCSLPRLVVEQEKPKDNQAQPNKETKVDDQVWERPAWRRRRRREEEGEGDGVTRNAKKPRMQKETEEWGLSVPKKVKERNAFFTKNVARKVVTAKYKQQKLRVQTEGEEISRTVIREVIMRVEHQAALANKDEDGLCNYELSKIECGVEQIVSSMIDRVVHQVPNPNRERELNPKAAGRVNRRKTKLNPGCPIGGLERWLRSSTPNPNLTQKKLEWECGARGILRKLADRVVELVEGRRSNQNSTPNTNLKTKINQKKMEWEYGARDLVRSLADRAVDESRARKVNSTPSPTKRSNTNRKQNKLGWSHNSTQARTRTSIKCNSEATASKILISSKIKNQNILSFFNILKKKEISQISVDQPSLSPSNGKTKVGGGGGARGLGKKRQADQDINSSEKKRRYNSNYKRQGPGNSQGKITQFLKTEGRAGHQKAYKGDQE